jgi:hypothetical protein
MRFLKNPFSNVKCPMHEAFELDETFGKDSHWWRYLLKCRDCGQLYFFEFLEQVDFDDGEDPQWSTWIPVATENEAEVIN